MPKTLSPAGADPKSSPRPSFDHKGRGSTSIVAVISPCGTDFPAGRRTLEKVRRVGSTNAESICPTLTLHAAAANRVDFSIQLRHQHACSGKRKHQLRFIDGSHQQPTLSAGALGNTPSSAQRQLAATVTKPAAQASGVYHRFPPGNPALRSPAGAASFQPVDQRACRRVFLQYRSVTVEATRHFTHTVAIVIVLGEQHI